MAVLRVRTSFNRGKVYELDKDSTVLGRDPGDGVRVIDQGVSRRHAAIVRRGELFFIKDLGSRNGTFVNENRVTEELLRYGDQIRIGNSVFFFEDTHAHLRDSSRILHGSRADDERVRPKSAINFKGSVLETDTAIDTGPRALERKESRNLHVLYQIAGIIGEEKGFSALMRRVSSTLGAAIGADHLYILWRKAEDAEDFEILARYDRTKTMKSPGVSRGIVQYSLKHRQSVLTSDASFDEHFKALDSVAREQIRSVICVPISVVERDCGVAYAYSDRSEAFRGEDLELCSAAGIHLGTSIGLLRMAQTSDRLFRDSIKTIVSAIEMREPEERGESRRVAGYCLAMARELGGTPHDLRNAWLAGMLHRIGTIVMTGEPAAVDEATSVDEAAARPGRQSTAAPQGARAPSFALLAKMNRNARDLLSEAPTLAEVLPALENQAERWNGTGAPAGKRGNEIPKLAQILAVGIELDHLLYGGGSENAGGRAGVTGVSVKHALLLLREGAGHAFHPEVVEALMIAYRRGTLFNQKADFFDLPL